MPNGHQRCECHLPHGPAKRIVVTGGPGAGKTATLDSLIRAEVPSCCLHAPSVQLPAR